MSTETQVTALKVFLKAATKAEVYDHDGAQKARAANALPANYTVIYFTRRFLDTPVRGDTRDTSGRRLQTRPCAQSVANVRLLEDRIADAFEHSTVSLDGTPVHFAYETGGGNHDLDGGYYTDLTSWTTTV